MLYIRKLFTQDLRDGKQIAFPKEVSNSFFSFDYINNEADRRIKFTFRASFGQFQEFDGREITTRLYAAGSESRMDGEVKAFIRDELNAQVDDLLIFKNKGTKHIDYDVMFVPKSNSQYYPLLLQISFSENHSVYSAEEQIKEVSEDDLPLQQIFYGAPGTGKSHEIKEKTATAENEGRVIRTTFHPDSDYSTFVGAYKPTTVKVPVMTIIGKEQVPVDNAKPEKKIVYEFVPQAFLKAYAGAWKKQDAPFYLIIEEINRGNCAQIFGDLFQLLDRNDEGESEYPISPDEDILKFLLTNGKYGFADLTEEQKASIPEKIKTGQTLKLPKNLHIWATMNTSDQSLFPIDSAFKRRWDWKYMKIAEGKDKNGQKLDWKIDVPLDDDGNKLSWWAFIQKINEIIASMTSSADKQLGYFFCTAKNKEIDKQTFVSKVIFYLWNDVFKDYGFEDTTLFRYKLADGTEKDLTFPDFYDEDGKDVNAERLADFLKKVMNWKKNGNKGD